MADKGIDLQDPLLPDYPGTGDLPEGALLFTQDPATRKSYRTTVGRVRGKNVGGTGGAPVALIDYTVSLAGGKTMGTFKTGDFIAKGTPYDHSFFYKALVEDIYPTYATASVSVSQSAPADGEVGESVSNTITGTFNPGDAGAIVAMRAYRGNQAQIGASDTASPIVRTTQMVRGLSPTGIWAVADYAAGAKKLVQPAGTPDTRPAQVRNPNAPQAAEIGLSSPIIYFSGRVPWFYGSSATDTQPDIYAGNKVIADSSGQLQVPSFGSGTQWLWFAVPRNADGSAQKAFTAWYRTALDNGAIGGSSNLFRSPVRVPVTARGLAQNWARDFDLYFTNYATVADTPTTLS